MSRFIITDFITLRLIPAKYWQLALCLSLSAGISNFCFLSVSHAADSDKEILYWVAPMDANYRRDKAGKSPMGMDLIPVYADADAASGGGSISISAGIEQNLGVRTEPAELGRLWRGIDTVAYVDYDQSKVSHVHLRTEGWIENLAVIAVGDRIKKGDFLFKLYSPKLVNAQEELVTALLSGNKALIQASKARLAALGVSATHIKQLQKNRKVKQHISVYAHHDGVVTHLKVREGMFVTPKIEVMAMADLSSVWLLAQVFARQSAWVEVGQMAEVTLSHLPGKTWQGKVEFIYPSLDPETRTLQVRLRFDNPHEKLKPNMYANVKIFGGAVNNIIIIPLEGLIRSGREQRVIVALGEGKFEAREVLAGIESGHYVEIINGVEAGDNIVVSGQFLIDSEASMRGSIRRLTNMTTPSSMMGDSALEHNMINHEAMNHD